jgi:cobalt/nickel transport system permease protein
MHIPDGYLGPTTCVAGFAAMAPVWAIASHQVKKTLQSRQVPLLAIGAAFSFVIMMFNIPIPGGTTGHAVGAVLVAILLGPWAACIAVSVALVIQALLFGDGGITAIGANCFNMAFAMPFAGYAVYRTISVGSSATSIRRVIGAGVAGYVGILVSALFTGIELGLQPLLHHTTTGHALYCPYGLRVAVTTMVGEHLLLFGWIELAVTALVVKYLQRQDPSLLHPSAKVVSAGSTRTRLWIGVAVLAILSPLGLVLPALLNADSAWGEWSTEQIHTMLGYIPAGMDRLSSVWHSPMPDYAPVQAAGSMHLSLAYILSACIGIVVCVAGVFVIGRLLSGEDGRGSRTNTSGFIERTLLGVVSLLKDTVSNDQIASRRGLLQRCDPRIKALSIALLLTCALLSRSLAALAAIYAVCVALALLSSITAGFFLKRTLLFIPLFSLLIVVPALFNVITPGDPVVSITGGLSITRQGIDSAAIFLLRVLASVSLAVLLVLTTRHHALLKVLRMFRVPRVFVMTMGMTYRYVYLLLDIIQNTFTAIRSRVGFIASTRTGRRVVASNMAGLWVRSYRMHTQVYDAMLSRGYTGEPKVLDTFRVKATDLVILACALLSLMGTLWQNHFSR